MSIARHASSQDTWKGGPGRRNGSGGDSQILCPKCGSPFTGHTPSLSEQGREERWLI